MKIPTKLEEKKDELAIEFQNAIWRLEPYKDPPDEGMCFKRGFNACADLLLPEIEKLSEVITILGDKHIGMAMCFEKHGTRLNIPFLIDDCKNDAQRAKEALQSLREFLGKESEGGDV